jgi:putative transposase
MQTYESLKHTTWDCKYHVVFIPKCRRKVLYQGLRRELGEVFRNLAQQWECKAKGQGAVQGTGLCWSRTF